MFENPPDAVLYRILATPQRIAVVGCSPNPSRDSHHIALLLRDRGHRVFPVNPTCTRLLDQPCFESVRAIPGGVDMVDIFRRSEQAGHSVDEAIEVGASIVWMQLGVVDEAAASRARAAGLIVVMDRCPAIEYRRLF